MRLHEGTSTTGGRRTGARSQQIPQAVVGHAGTSAGAQQPCRRGRDDDGCARRCRKRSASPAMASPQFARQTGQCQAVPRSLAGSRRWPTRCAARRACARQRRPKSARSSSRCRRSRPRRTPPSCLQLREGARHAALHARRQVHRRGGAVADPAAVEHAVVGRGAEVVEHEIGVAHAEPEGISGCAAGSSASEATM